MRNVAQLLTEKKKKCGLNLLHACREYQNTTPEGMFLPINLHSTKHNEALISLWDLWEPCDSRRYYRKQQYTRSLNTLFEGWRNLFTTYLFFHEIRNRTEELLVKERDKIWKKKGIKNETRKICKGRQCEYSRLQKQKVLLFFPLLWIRIQVSNKPALL